MVFVNKAVLNSTPDLPISFLVRTVRTAYLCWNPQLILFAQFIQLVIAVLLLHLASFISSTRLSRYLPGKITVPALELKLATKLLPYVFVGTTGLIFNTLCLAKVDASFFQVRSFHSSHPNVTTDSYLSTPDCSRPRPSFHYRHFCGIYPNQAQLRRRLRRIRDHSRILPWRLSSVVFLLFPRRRGFYPSSGVRLHFLPHDRPACRPDQICARTHRIRQLCREAHVLRQSSARHVPHSDHRAARRGDTDDCALCCGRRRMEGICDGQRGDRCVWVLAGDG